MQRSLLILGHEFHQEDRMIAKRAMRVTDLGAVSLNAAKWKSVYGLTLDTQLTVEQSQMAMMVT